MKQQILDALGAPNEEVIYLVDVSSFIFRAYYSTGYLSASDGTPTGAVFGVANMLVSLLRDCEPQFVIVAMDSKTPTFRKEIYPAYKANRPPPPTDLVVQFPLVEQLVGGFGFAVRQKDGFEADDVIATIVRMAREEGKKCVIVSSDKDLQQLIGPDVIMLDTMKKAIIDAAAVEAKWDVPPSLLGDLLAIAGDSSDNIPGVPRVGPKTAAPLLRASGGLEALLADLQRIPSAALRKRMQEHAEDARLSRRLVTLRDDVPLPDDMEAARVTTPDASQLVPLLDRLEFTQLRDRLFPGLSAPVVPAPEVCYETVTDMANLGGIAVEIRSAGRFAVDLETTSVDAVVAQIVGIALSWRPFHGCYIPIGHRDGRTLPLAEVLAVLKPLLEDPAIGVIIQNLKYEDMIFRRHGIFMRNIAMDPMLASYLLRAQDRSHGLDALAWDILQRKVQSYGEVTQKGKGSQLLFPDVTVENATHYAAEDAEVAFCLADRMGPMIETAGMTPLLKDVEIPLARVLCGMELTGVKVDVSRLREMSAQFEEEIVRLEQRARNLAGREFNLASPKQLQEILFDELKLPAQKKTKTGFSTDVEVLEELSMLHDLPAVLLEHRTLAKLKNTYLDALPRLVNPETGRIHTSFNQAVAATGRLSSSNPNLQNIPVRTERGRDIRRSFVAEEGMVLLSADYSQIELRILAHLSGDAALMAAYRRNEDIHVRTARAIYGIPEEGEVTRAQRAAAKTVNFGVIYGKTAFSLAKELGISRPQAQQFIDAYFQLYAGVARYMEEVTEQVRREGAVCTLMGRRREIPDIRSANFSVRQQGERMARNMPIQGTAADLLKVAMIRVDRALGERRFRARMVLTVHDELVLEVPESELDAVRALVVREMAGAAVLDVPLVVDTGVGPDWAAAH